MYSLMRPLKKGPHFLLNDVLPAEAGDLSLQPEKVKYFIRLFPEEAPQASPGGERLKGKTFNTG